MSAADVDARRVDPEAELADAERRTLRKVARHLMLYIILGQFFVQLDRTNIGFAQLTMSRDIAVSATVFGFAAGIFALAAFCVQVPASVLFERFGARRWLTSIMFGWGLVVVAQSFVQTGHQLVVLRFLLGALEAGFVPAAYVLVSLWFRGHRHGQMISALQIGTALSGMLGAPFAGWILGQSVLGLSGWRMLFSVEGGCTMLWSLLALRILHDGPGSAAWLSADERSFMARYLGRYQEQKAAGGAIETGGLLASLKDGRILALILSYTCAGWVSATFAFFMPTLLKTAGKGMDVQTVGLMAIGPYLVMAIVAYTWGKHADRTERHWHCVLPLLLGVSGILLYPLATTPVLAMVSLAMVQAGSSGFFVNFWPTCNMVLGKNTITRATALINAGTHIGSFVAPIYFGWALDTAGNTHLGLMTCVGVLLLNFVIMNVFFFRLKARQARAA